MAPAPPPGAPAVATQAAYPPPVTIPHTAYHPQAVYQQQVGIEGAIISPCHMTLFSHTDRGNKYILTAAGTEYSDQYNPSISQLE